ncbi:MAG: IS1595 family transposase [Pseudorhodoplanes sp.]|nr:IS1595 family transposase [Pseudorhodoplanes sp.]
MTALTAPQFTNEAAAIAHLEASRWADGVSCPHCGSVNVHRMGGETQKGMFLCNDCRDKFTARTGTVMERSHIPVHKWLLAIHLMNASKKGMSAHQLHRMLGITYKSAWFLAHRIREAMRDDKPAGMGGAGHQVQADETYYGNTSKRAKHYRKGHSHKSGVVALVNPATGEARAFQVESATTETVRDILYTNVHRASTLVTDESNLYKYTGKSYRQHETVIHTGREYVNKDGYTTNNVENFFGIFKKGMVGVYHFCGEQHLQRYLNEFAFRYTHRSGLGVSDNERAALALKGIEGKRLTYRRPN